MKAREELPDSSRSNRCSPILPELQHPPTVHAAHHHLFSIAEGVKGTEIRVPSHSGVIAVAGWVIVASPGVITVTNTNVADREKGGGGGTVELDGERELETELAIDISASTQRAAGARGIWTIEMKEMSIDCKVNKSGHGYGNSTWASKQLVTRPSVKLSRSSRVRSMTAVDSPFSSESERAEDGRFIWCGTRDGCLFGLYV